MMVARQAGFGRARENGSHDATHGILRQSFVIDRGPRGHAVSVVLRCLPCRERKRVEGFCCPVPSETAPCPAKGKDFEFRLIALHYAARRASA